MRRRLGGPDLAPSMIQLLAMESTRWNRHDGIEGALMMTGSGHARTAGRMVDKLIPTWMAMITTRLP